jgi:hypothetical protein
MNKEQLLQENLLLRQQVEQLTNQLEESTKQVSIDNLNWKPLLGKVWNAAAEAWLKEITDQAKLLNFTKSQQHLVGQENENRAPVEPWTPMHEARLNDYRTVLRRTEAAHAVCEARERKRNSTLGLPPTVSELAELITKPEAEEVANVVNSTTPKFNREFSQVQPNPEPEPPSR